MEPVLTFRMDEDPGLFWGHYRRLVREVVVPYQYQVLNDLVELSEPSHAIRNLRIAAGLEKGEFYGWVFQDSDVGKWIEAASYSLATQPDPALEQSIDATVEVLAQAQQPDGYLNSYFTVKEPGKRWTNLGECHELYCAGHLLEGAIAYFQATGKRRFLEVMLRYVDLIARVFGPGPHQIRGYDGHEEIEWALVRLWEVSQDAKHLALARFFLEERGRQPSFFHQEWEARGRTSHWRAGEVSSPPDANYLQAHLPVRDQREAVGHAVRAVYLYTALAAIARIDNDEALQKLCETLWEDITHRKMYLTGAIGSTHQGEAFTDAYDLPPELGYGETCASIGLVFFSQQLLLRSPQGRYADAIERALYNAVLGSVAQDGKKFFYVNPLETVPSLSQSNPDRRHVKAERQPWFSCCCCPPNLARLLLSWDRYVGSVHRKSLYLHQFVPGRGSVQTEAGCWDFTVTTNYPHEGTVSISLAGVPAGWKLALRRPGWCAQAQVTLDGRPLAPTTVDGYFFLEGPWSTTSLVELSLDLSPRFVVAHPQVRAVAGRVAVERGPLVYCLEECDNGPLLADLCLDTGVPPRDQPRPELALGLPGLSLVASRSGPADGPLYQPLDQASRPRQTHEVHAVPYLLWGNRGLGEMAVWLRHEGGAPRR